MRIAVRRAELRDLAWIVCELRVFAQSLPSKRTKFSSNQAIKKIKNMIENHFVIVAERGEDLLGVLAAYDLDHPFFDGQRTLSENFWWVAEEARGTLAGPRLLHEYVRFGVESGADIITMGLGAESLVRERSLTKRGFRLAERCFIMERPVEMAVS